MDWTGLDWTGLTFCTNCIRDTKHATTTSIQVSVYIVFFCYFEEALQPCIPTVILKRHVTVTIAKQGRGGVAGLSALLANIAVHAVCTTQCQRSKFKKAHTSSTCIGGTTLLVEIR